MQSLLQIGLSNAIVATVAAIIASLLGRVIRRPALKHALWVLVLVKLLTPPVVQIPFAILSRASNELLAARSQPVVSDLHVAVAIKGKPAIESASAVQREPAIIDIGTGQLGSSRTSRRDFQIADIVIVLGFLWLAGSIICGITILVRMLRFERLLRFGEAAPPEITDRIERLSRRIRLQRAPDTIMVPGAVCPMVWCGIGRPRLLLPSDFWARLDPIQRDTLLLHELAHLRRRDHWVRWIEAAATVAFWWLPVCWWARHELREAEEQCCDAWVVRILPRSFQAYAAALLDAAEFVNSQPSAPLLASGVSQFTHLKRRLVLIKRGDVPQSLRVSGICGAIGFGLLVLPAVPIAARAAAMAPARVPQEHRDDAIASRADSTPESVATNDDTDPQRQLDEIESRANQMLLELRELRKQRRSPDGQTGNLQQR